MRVEVILRTIPESVTEPAIQVLVGQVRIPIFPSPPMPLSSYSLHDLLQELTERAEDTPNYYGEQNGASVQKDCT